MNKNVSVWRGALSPPTHTHIWVKDNGQLYEYRDREWQLLIPNATDQINGLMSKTDKEILDILNTNLHWN